MDILIFEGTTIVNDDGLGDTIPAYDVIEDKFGDFFTSNVCHRDGFNPFREVFGGGDDELIAI